MVPYGLEYDVMKALDSDGNRQWEGPSRHKTKEQDLVPKRAA